jgi:polyisoprenoid-binding protein YceI
MRIASLAAVLALLVACDNKTSPPTPTSSGTTGTSTGTGTAPSSLPKGQTTYHFGVKPTHTKVTFQSKNAISNILGESNNVVGSATIDFEGGSGTCELSVPTLSLDSGYTDRDRAMMSPTWLDAAKHPNIVFKGEKATLVEKPDMWKIDGKFTLRGVTNDMSVMARVRPKSALLGQKLGFGDGPCVRVETEFKVKLADYKIEIPKTAIATVEPEISLVIDLWGSTVKPEAVVAKGPPDEMVKGVPKPKVSEDGIEGTKYILGKKPNFTTLTAESTTDLEKITAKTSVLAGFIGVDLAKGTGKVRLAVPTASLKTANTLRDEHLLSAGWLDAAQFKTIEFESTKATKKSGDLWTVEGDFTMHGVKKPITVEVTLREIPLELVKKANWGDTPGLGFACSFKLKLSDFGVKIPEQAIAKVSDELTVAIDLVALQKGE